MNEGVMCDLYKNFAKGNGWLSKLIEMFFLSDEEVRYLTWLDDQEMEMQDKVKLFEKQVEADGGQEIAFLDAGQEKLDIVCHKLAQAELAWDEADRRDASIVEQQIILQSSDYHRLRKLRKRLRAHMLYGNEPNARAVSERDLALAREFPLEKLIETRRGYTLCPFHQESTPSFYVKGFGYCFGCGKSCDAIEYLMTIEKMSFINAVKRLAHES